MTEEKRIFYLKNLNHPDITVRTEAIRNLGKIDDPHIFKILSSHFSDSHPEIREVLLQVFSAQVSRHNAEIVADTLHSPQLSVRSLAMEILKTMQSEAVFPLRRLTKSTKADIRKISAELLGDIQDDRTSDILAEIVQDDDETVRLAVIEALGKQKDIRAIPNLLALYEQNENHKPAILGALNKIFLHWEKFVLKSDFFDADPWLALAFINAVQENGNASSLNLIIRWLNSNKLSDIKDELLKALEAILTKNTHVMLPNHLFPCILEIQEQYADELPDSIYYTCLSRIPNSDAMKILLESYNPEYRNELLEEALIHNVSYYFSIFSIEYKQIQFEKRIRILEMLLENNVQIYDTQILNLYKKAKNEKEKSILLDLALNSKMPGAKKILLAKLSGKKNSQLDSLLEKLLRFHDESLWNLYLKYVNDHSSLIRNKAVSGLLQYPQKTIDYALNSLNQSTTEIQRFWLGVIFQLPKPYIDKFLSQFLKTLHEDKFELLSHYLTEKKHKSQLPLILSHLKDKPEYLQFFIEILQKNGFELDQLQELDHLSFDELEFFKTLIRDYRINENENSAESENQLPSPQGVEYN